MFFYEGTSLNDFLNTRLSLTTQFKKPEIFLVIIFRSMCTVATKEYSYLDYIQARFGFLIRSKVVRIMCFHFFLFLKYSIRNF